MEPRMTTPADDAAEKLLARFPLTAAAALSGDRGALVDLLSCLYNEGRIDTRLEILDERLRELREQREARCVTSPTVEFPLKGAA